MSSPAKDYNLPCLRDTAAVPLGRFKSKGIKSSLGRKGGDVYQASRKMSLSMLMKMEVDHPSLNDFSNHRYVDANCFQTIDRLK